MRKCFAHMQNTRKGGGKKGEPLNDRNLIEPLTEGLAEVWGSVLAEEERKVG